MLLGQHVSPAPRSPVDVCEVVEEESPLPKRYKREEEENKEEEEENQEALSPDRYLDLPKDSDSDYESKEERDLARKFRKQVVESEGFDYTDYPKKPMRYAIGGIRPVFFQEDEDVRLRVEGVTISAINDHSEKRGQKQLEFVRLERATKRSCAGQIFYVTFVAKDMSSGGAEVVYRAKIWKTIKKGLRVMLFEPKP